VKRLVLLRHGQTAWNAERRGQGHTDVLLDDTGHLQAKSAARLVAAYAPSLLFSSDLARAVETASYVAEVTGLTPTFDARLREYDLGERTGLTMDEYAQRFPQEYAAFRAGRFEAVAGAETSDDVLARFRPALDDVVAALAPGGTAVVVAHGGALKVAVRDLLGWPSDADATLAGMDNCGWAVLVAATEDPASEPLWRLSAYNLTAQDPDFASGPGVG
jgi:glucosyl-3-phosphoglycerate phosphatase